MRKHKKYELRWQEWTLLGLVAVAVITVTVAVVSGVSHDPLKDAERELQTIADDYYLYYLYPRLIGSNPSVEDAMSIYDENGVPTVYLRQLLQYNDGEHADSAETFETLNCNTNVTGVRYYPEAPYGPRDYTAKYIWHCGQEKDKED